MKNFIIFILFSFLAINTNAFVKDTVATKIDTTSLTYTKVYNDVKQSISTLSESLKTPAEHVYKVVVKQQIVNSWNNLIFCLFTVVLTIISLKIVMNKNNYSYYSDDSVSGINTIGIIGIILGVLSLTFIIVSIININETITGFTNPEYGAIKDIVNFIK